MHGPSTDQYDGEMAYIGSDEEATLDDLPRAGGRKKSSTAVVEEAQREHRLVMQGWAWQRLSDTMPSLDVKDAKALVKLEEHNVSSILHASLTSSSDMLLSLLFKDMVMGSRQPSWKRTSKRTGTSSRSPAL